MLGNYASYEHVQITMILNVCACCLLLRSRPYIVRREHAMELLPRRILDHAHPPDIVALVHDQDSVSSLEPEFANLARPERVLGIVDHAAVHNRVRVARDGGRRGRGHGRVCVVDRGR